MRAFCSVEGCGKKHHSGGLCSMHDLRVKRYGQLDLPVRDRICQVEGCERRCRAHQFCNKHYKRWVKHGEPDVGGLVDHAETCRVEGCEGKYWAKDLCHEHYNRSNRKAPGLHKIKKEHGFARSDDRGHKLSAEYRTWQGMKARCNNPNTKCYPTYGGRGIKVCEEWNDDFEAFYEYIGPRPEGMSIDRIDVNGNYEPGNVRWATAQQQRNNQRKKETSMSSLIDNIDKEIKKAKTARKVLDKEIKGLEQAKLALQGSRRPKKTTAKKAVEATTEKVGV